METSEGVCYIAFGKAYLEMAYRSLATLRRVEPSIPVVVLTDRETTAKPVCRDKNLRVVQLNLDREQNRSVKTQLHRYVSFDRCLYLDADTVVLRPIRPVFKHLEAFDFCISFCAYCINEETRHLVTEDKEATLAVCPGDSLHYQCGVFCWRGTPETSKLFRMWYKEWKRFQKHDQGAFARAVWQSDVRLGLLWRDEWNVLMPTLHVHGRIMHYADRKTPGLGDVFPKAETNGPVGHSNVTLSESKSVERAGVYPSASGEQLTSRSDLPERLGESRSQDIPKAIHSDDPNTRFGVCYVAYGDKNYELAVRSLSSLRASEPDLPATILTDGTRRLPTSLDEKDTEIEVVIAPAEDLHGYSAKTQVPFHVKYERCLVLDVDSLILRPVSSILDYLEAFDLCLAFDPRGVLREARHLCREERVHTFALCTDSSLFYEPGVMSWRRTSALLDFYRRWHEEWKLFPQHVEGALARAIWRSQVRVGVLWPGVWNHSKRSAGLRILRPPERFPDAPGSAILTPPAAQSMSVRSREAKLARDRKRYHP